MNDARAAEFWEAMKNYVGGHGSASGSGVPKGTILIWSGTAEDIPEGWVPCGGKDGRPDLRDKFVLGAGEAHGAGETGGSEEVTLTTKQILAHTHVILQARSSSGDIIYNQRMLTENVPAIRNTSISYDYITTGAQGPNYSHSNMPPYYALCYIIKL